MLSHKHALLCIHRIHIKKFKFKYSTYATVIKWKNISFLYCRTTIYIPNACNETDTIQKNKTIEIKSLYYTKEEYSNKL